MDPVKQGQRAAWTIFVVALGLYVLAAIVIRGTQTDPNCQAHQNCRTQALDRGFNLAMVGVWIGFVGLLAAGLKSQELPPESRKAFWLTGLICMALSGLLGFSSCAVEI